MGKLNRVIGGRYMPLFDGEWVNKEYEPLTVVTKEGTSYTSKKYVPIGIDVSNSEYWAISGNYNQQMAAINDKIIDIKNVLDGIKVFATPQMYGAKADGKTDDTIAIQKALDKNNVVYFPSGNYVISSRLVLRPNTKMIGESSQSVYICNSSNDYSIQCGTEYDYQAHEGEIKNISFKSMGGYKAKGVLQENNAPALIGLRFYSMLNPIQITGKYKDMITIKRCYIGDCSGSDEETPMVNIACNCDALTIEQLRGGRNTPDDFGALKNSLRVRYCTGGSITDSIIGAPILIERSNNLSIENLHMEGYKGLSIKIVNSNVSIEGLYKWRIGDAADIILIGEERMNSTLTIKDADFVYYPLKRELPTGDVFQKDEYSKIIASNCKNVVQLQSVVNAHSNINLVPEGINPYNGGYDNKYVGRVEAWGRNNGVGLTLNKMDALEFDSSYDSYYMYVTSDPDNKNAIMGGEITLDKSAYGRFNSYGEFPSEMPMYVIIYGKKGGSYVTKWTVPIGDNGIVFTTGNTWNLSTGESGQYDSEKNSYTLINSIAMDGYNRTSIGAGAREPRSEGARIGDRHYKGDTLLHFNGTSWVSSQV